MIDVVIPNIFRGYNHLEAVFTKANRSVFPSKDYPDGINFGFTTNASLQEIEKNYQKLLKQLNLKRENLALAKQVHGNGIKIITEGGIYPDTDGLITSTKNVYIGIQVADCAAILVADPLNKIIGAFHAGWRGAVSGIIPAGLDMMEKEGGNAENFHAYISPCISQKAFEVGEEVAQLFPDQFCDKKSYHKTHVDLPGYITKQLTSWGIPPVNIELSDECTFGNTDFFSFRRERESAGRMLALIGLK
ncbi:MAG: peptidoglycan editing factor PgeF [Balneolaceae bacterium]|nr:MAG: peptidoglycan editing factor PgeF [Balneolaceae bacterium]